MKITLKTYNILKWTIMLSLGGLFGGFIGMSVEAPLSYFIAFVGGVFIGWVFPKVFDSYFLKDN